MSRGALKYPSTASSPPSFVIRFNTKALHSERWTSPSLSLPLSECRGRGGTSPCCTALAALPKSILLSLSLSLPFSLF